jgi:hypothetical protein
MEPQALLQAKLRQSVLWVDGACIGRASVPHHADGEDVRFSGLRLSMGSTTFCAGFHLAQGFASGSGVACGGKPTLWLFMLSILCHFHGLLFARQCWTNRHVAM